MDIVQCYIRTAAFTVACDKCFMSFQHFIAAPDFFIKCQSDGYALIRAYTADGNRQLEVSADTAEFLRVKLHILPYFASVKFYIRSGVIVDVKYNFSRFCTIFFIC